MQPKRKRRLLALCFILVGIAIAVSLSLYALKQNINLYFTPSQIKVAPKAQLVRIGGLVQEGSVKRIAQSLQVKFVLTDGKAQVPVDYTGILPDLFREGQGIIAQGKLDPQGKLIATEVLAKHDERYQPPKSV
jgi:cytochrome c-type biogenesis protein CcmE